MGNGGVRGQNRRFHRRAIAVGEDPMERNLNHILVIQLNLIVTTGIEESIERLLQPGFELSDNADDLVDRLLVQHTARSVDEQTNVFMKLNVRRKKYHGFYYFPQQPFCSSLGSFSGSQDNSELFS